MGAVTHQLGLGTQVDYDTKLDPVTKWYEVLTDTGVRLVQGYARSNGIRSGQTVPRASTVQVTTAHGEGALNMEVPRNGFGHIIQHVAGTDTPTSVQQGATTAYLQTFTAGGWTKSFTMQTGIQRVDDPTVVEPFTAIGCMFTGWTIGVSVGEFLIFNGDIHAKDVLSSSDAEALDTAAYAATTQLYSWEQCALTIDAVAVPLVNSWSLTASRNADTEKYHLGEGGFPSQPRNTPGDTFTGTFSADFSALTNWYDLFHDNTTVAMVFTATGDNISGAFDQKLTITLPAVKLVGDGPVISDGLVMVDIPFEVYGDASGTFMTWTYMTTDTTV